MNVQITFTPRADLRKRIHEAYFREASELYPDAKESTTASIDTISGYVLPQLVRDIDGIERQIADTIVRSDGKHLVPCFDRGTYVSGKMYKPSEVLKCWFVDGVELPVRSPAAMHGISIHWPLYVWSIPDIYYIIDTELDLRIEFVFPQGFVGIWDI